MADHIDNEGGKARTLLYIFLFFFLVIITWVYVYRSNFQLEF